MYNLTKEFQKFDYECLNLLSKDGRTMLMRGKNGQLFVQKRMDAEYGDIYKRIKELDIKGIPKIFEIYSDKHECVVNTEYIKGMTVGEAVGRFSTIDENSAAKYICSLCETLKTIHEAGIIHRDITSSNVILAADRAYLIDFGIARFKKNNAASDTELLGTAGYAAPEQFGFSQTDARSDIYALGKLFEFMVGENYNGRYKKIITKSIQMDPEKRYSSAEKLIKAIKNSSGKKRNHLNIYLVLIAAIETIALVSLFHNYRSQYIPTSDYSYIPESNNYQTYDTTDTANTTNTAAKTPEPESRPNASISELKLGDEFVIDTENGSFSVVVKSAKFSDWSEVSDIENYTVVIVDLVIKNIDYNMEEWQAIPIADKYFSLYDNDLMEYDNIYQYNGDEYHLPDNIIPGTRALFTVVRAADTPPENVILYMYNPGDNTMAYTNIPVEKN